jgi:S-ribosylhomocysteine lyase LuxS involved in autoinducer biosynthesis
MTQDELEKLDARFASLMIDYGISNLSVIGFFEMGTQTKSFAFCISNPEHTNVPAGFLCQLVFKAGVAKIIEVPGACITKDGSGTTHMIVKSKKPNT